MCSRKLAKVSMLAALAIGAVSLTSAMEREGAHSRPYASAPPAPERQTARDVLAKSLGCVSCHSATDHATMHVNPGVLLGCTDCHGGNAEVVKPANAAPEDSAYRAATDFAHVLPRYPKAWNSPSSANPERSYTLLNRESPEFVRFINPGDYRVAREACGACHLTVIQAAERSLMSTSAMLWGGASYNNGILPYKRYIIGEAYTTRSEPATLVNPVPVTPLMTDKGMLGKLFPLPAWETVPVADVFRVFERGGRVIQSQFPEIGLPNNTGAIQKLDEPGRPDIRQSNRGPGTGLRIAVPVINITKTRLNDPHMWFMGTNDQPGDYRSSGCSGCHVVYANDRDPKHSGPYAAFGNSGRSQSADPTIPKDESGHPVKHTFTRVIPSSQCMVCHMHQPNVFVNSYYGYIMWDYESDAPFMWPEKQRYPTSAEMRRILDRNPEEAAVRGKWSDPEFLREVSTLNPKLKDTQFADYHGHGWTFRAVFKRDRHGALLDRDGKAVADDDPDRFKKAVHLSSIHADLGFQCADCHFAQDSHGNGHIYGEVAAAIEIDCADCHGTTTRYPTLFTSGPASRPGGTDMSLLRTQDGRKRFEWREGTLYQRAALDPDREWEVSLVKDTVNPASPKYNPKAARAKLMSTGDSMQWGPGVDPEKYAHGDDKMTCYTCHLSWTTSCAGCHLPIQANWKTDRLHYEGGETRNFATYNPQVARDDAFQLGRHGSVKGNKIAPIRSSSALVLSSTNINRERIYIQQPPIAASGFSSQAFAPHYPHTERKIETKTCSDCHISQANDNNAIMAQLMLQGTNFVNFVGYNAWVGEEKGVAAVQVTEWEEPQAVIGSYLHRYAYPDWFSEHQKRDLELPGVQTHATRDAARCVQLRGEYLYVAEGRGGMRVYDVASIGNKGFSQRIISAPFSPWGQDTHIASANATCVALPTNQSIAPLRNQGELMRVTNQEQPFHPIYNYAAITDSVEGLILTDVNSLADRDPQNNFLKRALTWNQGGILNGARHIVLGGHYAYIAADAGLVVVDLDDPLRPKLEAIVALKGVRASALQFRYLFVLDDAGLTTVDVTDPTRPRHVGSARVPLADAHRVYVARTYAYVAADKEGLAIIDIERPELPTLVMTYTAEGKMTDARDVVVGSTNASLFAYVADGVNGLKVLQLTAPDTQPRFYGFSPEPKPKLIAWRRTATPALSLSKGLDRDRAVDETGGQIAVFGRIGSRPFTSDEMKRIYQRPDGSVWTVSDDVRTQEFVPARAAAAEIKPAAAQAVRYAMKTPDEAEAATWLRAAMAPALLILASAAWAQGATQPAAPQSGAHPPLPYQVKDKSVGVVNCANSLCHGSVQPFKESNVLQTEYVTWSRVDKHARAYRALFNAQSARIARNLGIGNAAEAKVCLDCHAHNIGAAQRGERFKFDDGVSCEACHGPAERWLPKHVEDGATHAANLDAGLFPTDDPVERARLCLSCHMGNADRFVTHRLMGAGHPRLAFELETFTGIEPAHFKIDSDWEKRKRLWDGVKVWAIGQALAVSEMMDVLADPKRGRDGLFPELVLFDCHACHHPMSDRRWAPRVPGLGPGVVRLNDSSMLMVRAIARVVAPTLGSRIASTMNRLQRAVSGSGDALGQARLLKSDMGELIAALDKRTMTDSDMRAVFGALFDEGLNGEFRDYAGAEQATMAIGSVANFMYQKGMLKSARNINAGLANLQAAVANDERYNPARFEAALKNFRATVGL